MQVPKANLVFLPGWSYAASVFAIMKPYFATHQLAFVDLPKLSCENNDPTMAKFVANLPDNSILIGWSLGGLFAIHLCALFPDKIAKLVLLASAPKFPVASGWTEKFQSLVCFPSVSRSQRHYFSSHRKAEADPNLSYLFQTDLREEFANLAVPVISLAGDKDAILPYSATVTHCIPGAGHGLLYTHTDTVCQHINQFLL